MASKSTKGAARYGATGGLGLLIYFVGGAPVWVLWAALGCLGVSGGILVAKKRKRIKRKLRSVPLPAKPRRQPQRRKPAVQKMSATSRGMQPARPTAPPPKPRVGKHLCSAACRMSKKPAHTCDCSCGGRQHGVYARKGSDRRWSAAQAAPQTRAPRAEAGKPLRRPAAPPVRSVNEQRGWRSLQAGSKAAMEGHAAASPRCAGGTATAKTIRDRRTDPPIVTQQLTCDTCGKRVR